jgi:hypothetical protein
MNIDEFTHVLEFPECIGPDGTHNKFFLTTEEAIVIREIAYASWGMTPKVEAYMLDLLSKYPDLKMVSDAYSDKSNNGYLRKVAGEDRIVMQKLIDEG